MGTRKGRLYVGLAACVVLAAGLFVVVQRGWSPSPTPSSDAPSPPIATGVPAPTRTIGAITWHEGGLLPGAIPQAFPLVRAVVPIGDRLLAVGDVDAEPEGRGYVAAVWSSTDAVTWNLITNPDSFSTDKSDAVGAAADGHGGIYVIGSVSSEERQTSGDALWHSTDGVTWTRITVDQSLVLRNSRIAVGDGMVVVTGWVSEEQQAKRYVWYSTDGLTWTRTELAGETTTGYGTPALIAGGDGGFEIVDPVDSEPRVREAWHSDDGRTWAKTEPPGTKQTGTFTTFLPTSLLVSNGTFVAIGHDGGGAETPSAWTSKDGLTWSRSTIEDPSPAFGCSVGCQPTAVAKVGSALVALGYRTKDRTTLPVSAPIVTWVSTDDGRTWRVRGSGSPGVLPLFLVPFDSGVAMLGEQLPIGAQLPDVEVRSARGTIVWQAGESAAPSPPSIRPTSSNKPLPGPSLKTGPISFKQATMPKGSAQPWSTSTISYVNGRFYSVFNRPHGSLLWESDDGTTWRPIAGEAQFNGAGKQDCAFVTALTEDGNGGLVAVGGMDGTCTGTVTAASAAWQSSDGVTWRKATIQPSQTGVLWHVAYAGGNLVAVGEDGEELFSADHGRTWQPGSMSVSTGGIMAVTPWQDGFIASDGGHAWRSSDGRAWVAMGPAPEGVVAVGPVLVGVSDGLYWSLDGATWTAADGAPFQALEHWTIGSDGRVAIAVDNRSEMWVTTDGRTWRDTGSKLIVTASGEHGQVPSFCIGAGRLVTIISDGNLTRAYYADFYD